MALRMNLYGCRLESLTELLGSKDSAVSADASERLAKAIRNEDDLAMAKAWLGRLIDRGYPLRESRPSIQAPESGELLVAHLETELHALALSSLVEATLDRGGRDYSVESSHWHHSSIDALYNDLARCGFTRSRDCPVRLHEWISSLSNGTPLFGDDFRSEWSFYSILRNDDLAGLLDVFRAAVEFTRELAEEVPHELRSTIQVRLSHEGRSFITDLSKWFSQIHQARQDAFILWS